MSVSPVNFSGISFKSQASKPQNTQNCNFTPLQKDTVCFTGTKATDEAASKCDNGMIKIHKAALDGDLDEIKRLLKDKTNSEVKEILSLKDDNDEEALHWAAFGGQAEVIDFICEKGADTEARNKTGRTPIFKSVVFGFYEATEALLKHKADPNAEDNNGKRTLDCTTPCTEIEQLLFNYGAKDKIRSSDEYTNNSGDFGNNDDFFSSMFNKMGKIESAKKTLGFEPEEEFTQKELKKHFRDLIMKNHPDKNSDNDAEERAKEINIAYSTLQKLVKK
jgi:ankyrin repeat protein